MAIRFRRSIKLAPGLRLNLSKSGASLSAGPRGASMTFGSRGAYLNTGIPGTGLYSRSRLGAGVAPTPQAAPGKVSIGATIQVHDDGTVMYLDERGQPLSDYLTNLAKRQQGAKIKELLIATSQRINNEVDALQKLHEFTPAPDDVPKRDRREFPKARPVEPQPRNVTFLLWLFGKKSAIESANASRQRAYESALAAWKSEKATFDESETAEVRSFSERLLKEPAFMQQVLEDCLQDISWPRETLVSFEIGDAGTDVAIDVDLPELEDLPTKTTSVPERGYKLNVKQIKPKQLNEIYSRLVHGIGFRIIGEVFATLPTVDKVTLSAYTQRDLPATGERSDTYIYSVSVERAQWAQINFKKLSAIDVSAALASFTLVRNINRAGGFEEVAPIDIAVRSPIASV